MRRIRESPISTPPSTGVAPPDSPEPAPRATQGTSASWQARTAAATSCADPGSTTIPGITAYCRRPSEA